MEFLALMKRGINLAYRLLDDDRSALVWLNYNKLDPKNINPFTPLGPNTLGEYLWPVEVDMKNELDRLGFSFAAPEGME